MAIKTKLYLDGSIGAHKVDDSILQILVCKMPNFTVSDGSWLPGSGSPKNSLNLSIFGLVENVVDWVTAGEASQLCGIQMPNSYRS